MIETDFVARRQAAWELVTIPGNRPGWQESDSVIEKVTKGRRGRGTQNHCMLGKDAIVDWRAFDYVTFTTLLLVPEAPKILMGFAFEERDDTARISRCASPNRSRKTRGF